MSAAIRGSVGQPSYSVNAMREIADGRATALLRVSCAMREEFSFAGLRTAVSAFPDGPLAAWLRFDVAAGESVFSAAELHASVRVAEFAECGAAPSVVSGRHWRSSWPPADALFLAAAAASGVPGFASQPAFPVAADIFCRLPRCRWLAPCICEPGLRSRDYCPESEPRLFRGELHCLAGRWSTVPELYMARQLLVRLQLRP